MRFSGSYHAGDGHTRGGKPTARITRGHSKDHRPDLKQLVWILTITADGAVPIAYRVADGNTVDDTTHIATWDHLVALLGRHDWLYVADCKLATRDNMDHIARAGGRFVSILPASRSEEGQFRDWVVDHDPEWVHAHTRPARRQDDPDDVYCTVEAPWPSAEGYRIVWVRSSAKTTRDAESRHDRIARGIAALEGLNQRLASPKTRMKTTVAVEQAATAALDKAAAARWVTSKVTATTEETYRQEKRGHPGNDTRYRKHTRTHHRVSFGVEEAQVAHDACSDGMFPLISNGPPVRSPSRHARRQPYPASYPRRPPKGSTIASWFPAAFRPTGIRFSGHPYPAEELVLPYGWLTDTSPCRTPAGLPRSAPMSYDRDGCLLYPGDGDAHPADPWSSTGACRFPAASPYTPLAHPIERSLR